MAVLLNQTSNLQIRLELLQRISDGTRSPASLAMRFSIERYSERRFVPLLEVARSTLFDMDLIQFLQSLEALFDGQAEGAQFEASVEPVIGLRLGGGPDAYWVEAGLDMLNILDSVGGMEGERGADLLLVRFAVNKRAAVAFCAQLLAEFEKFPSDPSLVSTGPREG